MARSPTVHSEREEDTQNLTGAVYPKILAKSRKSGSSTGRPASHECLAIQDLTQHKVSFIGSATDRTVLIPFL